MGIVIYGPPSGRATVTRTVTQAAACRTPAHERGSASLVAVLVEAPARERGSAPLVAVLVEAPARERGGEARLRRRAGLIVAVLIEALHWKKGGEAKAKAIAEKTNLESERPAPTTPMQWCSYISSALTAQECLEGTMSSWHIVTDLANTPRHN